MSNPIAVLCGDLHLSLTPPACRADKDWMAVQAHYLKQLRDLAEDKPVLCAGDVFDRWNAPAELISFAMRELPDFFYAVPGQHDLPNHRIEDVHRSAYGVLEEATRLMPIRARFPFVVGPVFVSGFGWNEKILSAPERMGTEVQMAVIHRYCWTEGKSYPDAPESGNVRALRKQLKGYDVALFGDNHQAFIDIGGNGCTIINCGGFMRRKSDEIDREPCVGLLFEDGSVKLHKLDTSIDKFHTDAKQREETAVDVQQFISELEELGEHGLNFREVVKRHLDDASDLSEGAKKIIRESLL